MPQRRDNARVQVLAHRNSCCRSVELSRLDYHTARLICNCIVYTYFHKVPDLLSGFRVNGIAVFATNFRISIALQIICVANCDAIPVKLLPVQANLVELLSMHRSELKHWIQNRTKFNTTFIKCRIVKYTAMYLSYLINEDKSVDFSIIFAE